MLRATGITGRTTLLAWTITLATLSIFVIIIVPEQKRDLQAGLESKARGVAAALQGEVAAAAVSEDFSLVVEHAMQVLSGDKSVEFLVVAKNDGYSVVVQRNGWHVEPHSGGYWRPATRRAAGAIEVVPGFGKRLLHYAMPFDFRSLEWGWIHVGLSLESYDRSVEEVYRRTGILVVVCILLSLFASVLYARRFVRPILQLQAVVEQVANGDLMARATIQSQDELEQLANAFNSMADAILHRDQALSEAKRDLERRVAERTQELREQIVAKDRAHTELADAQKSLVAVSRLSGMAEVATGVLHNVGNVLNSINVSAAIIADRLRESRIAQLGDLARQLQEQQNHLGDFLANDPRGKRILPYLGKLSARLAQERDELCKEAASLAQHVSHVKEIVAMQQTYARASGVIEKIPATSLLEDVISIVQPSLDRNGIVLQREFEDLPPLMTDRHKVLQLLLNLVRNAEDAVRSGGTLPRKIILRVQHLGEDRLQIQVADNGIGILPENLVRIFSHGFTTKKNGHGFGLHSGALAASQLGGSLTAESEGPERGATFTLELPLQAQEAARYRSTS
jgi:signal transduction histidine kinase